jgi:hypothetical protein
MHEQAEGNVAYRVLIVGCGQLGSRHLQAVAAVPQVEQIEVVDPNPLALRLGLQRLSEVTERRASTSVRWLSSLKDASRSGDLCIIATQAEGRCQLVKEVSESLGYSSFLLEKIVAQSVQEMEGLVQFAEAMGISAWVNCQIRTFPFHRRVKKHIGPKDAVMLSAMGSNQRLATNGIHIADLFAYFDESPRIDSAGASIDQVLHSSKRGPRLYDLSGTLHGYTKKGSRLNISYTDGYCNWEHISIATGRYRCVVDHKQGWAFESDADSEWAWRQVPFEGNLLVSQTTRDFAARILTSGKCPLPTLEQSLVSHRFILGELQPNFSRLLGRELDLCPVT